MTLPLILRLALPYCSFHTPSCPVTPHPPSPRMLTYGVSPHYGTQEPLLEQLDPPGNRRTLPPYALLQRIGFAQTLDRGKELRGGSRELVTENSNEVEMMISVRNTGWKGGLVCVVALCVRSFDHSIHRIVADVPHLVHPRMLACLIGDRSAQPG